MSHLVRHLLALPLILALTPAAHAQGQPGCTYTRQAGGGDSAFHGLMTVKPNASCMYLPLASTGGTRSGPSTFSGMDVTTPPQHGKLSISENGGQYRVIYLPNPGYVGPDHFELNGVIPGAPSRGRRVINVVVGQ